MQIGFIGIGVMGRPMTLNLLKRQMYGRANLDLLPLRVLHVA